MDEGIRLQANSFYDAEDIEIIEDIAEFPWTGQFEHRDIHQKVKISHKLIKSV